jgi:hypothetical protein
MPDQKPTSLAERVLDKLMDALIIAVATAALAYLNSINHQDTVQQVREVKSEVTAAKEETKAAVQNAAPAPVTVIQADKIEVPADAKPEPGPGGAGCE